MSPRLAIVIPIFRHSTLASEAINCALSLTGPLETVVVAVDDGCPHAETRAALQNWAAMAPDRFHHLHQANRGLSGARNTGISFAMARYPSLEAIYPLDADNLLDDHSLILFEHLLTAHPDADWFYPNFDMFGLNANEHNGGAFSVAQLAESNCCEAGSLIRREVFDAGVRFDESMRAGYEDWEFWLSAAREGFRGMPVRQSFFRYRKRPESMLSGSHGSDGRLRGEIRKRHNWLYSGDSVAQLAARQTPRFVVFETGDSAPTFELTDPRTAREVDENHVIGALVAASARPEQAPRPMAWCFARPGVLERLGEARLSASVLWHLHTGAMDADIAVARLTSADNGLRRITTMPPAGKPAGREDWAKLSKKARALAKEAFEVDKLAQTQALQDADILLLRVETVLALSNPAEPGINADAAALTAYIEAMRIHRIDVQLDQPVDVPSGDTPAESFKSNVSNLRLRRAEGDFVNRLAPWRTAPKISGPANMHWILRNQSLGGLPFPLLRHEGAQHIGFVLPIFMFGGVEKCVVALASALKQQGVHCHLFIYGHGAMTAADWLTDPFETIHQLDDPLLRDWGGPAYMGTNMAGEPPEQFLKDMMSALVGMDAIVVSGCAAAYYGFSALRAKGITTITWEHLLERDPYGRSYGTPYLAVAYEGAIDHILTCSHQLRDWLHGQGVPSEKLLALPNGPGFPMPPPAIEAALTARAQRPPDGPLRVGFLGRLDSQKGADRFIQIAEACRSLPMQFSITGGAVMGDAGLSIPDWIARHPAAFDLPDLQAAFARLDVLLMPSRDEGLPLTIMEAQRVGVIPMATDVGAVAEAIADGQDGFLIADTQVVETMTNRLKTLAADKGLRNRISRHASQSGDQWARNAISLLTVLEKKRKRSA